MILTFVLSNRPEKVGSQTSPHRASTLLDHIDQPLGSRRRRRRVLLPRNAGAWCGAGNRSGAKGGGSGLQDFGQGSTLVARQL
jgi:hypothetical protein